MKKLLLPAMVSTLALGAVLSVGAIAQTTTNSAAGTLTASGIALPARADDFQLVDQNRDAWRLQYFTNAPAIVIVSHTADDKVSADAAKALKALKAGYADSKVQFVMLDSTPGATRESVKAIAEAGGYNDLNILVDEQQLIGESLGVVRSGEAYVIDPTNWKVVYRGPLASSFAADAAKAKDASVKSVVDAMIAGNAVTPVAYAVNGKEIAFPARAEDHSKISYVKDVAPIIVEKCASCHTPGGIGPFAMDRYEVVKGFAPMIRETIRTDRMPPFFADPHVGEWLNDDSLDGEEIKTLVHWIEAGAPRGKGTDPLLDAVKAAPEWPLGDPDLVLTLPPEDVPATGIVEYKYPAVVNPSTESKWLKASTIIPGSRTTLHHVLSGYMDEMPAEGAIAAQSQWKGSVGSYTPGAAPQVLPAGSGVEVPAGGAIGFQMHYTTTGKAETDETRIGLYFHDEPPEYIKRSAVIMDATFALKPGEADQKEIAYLEFPHDAELYTVYPHAHYRGTRASLEAHYPDGTTELILDLPFYDFNWQRDYDFVKPKMIPAGTRMVARFTYDNSEQNKANPDPKTRVTWGDQTFEEMFYMRMNYRWVDETRDNQVGTEYDREMMQSLMTGMVDDNLDGKVSLGERMKMVNVLGMMGDALGTSSPGAAGSTVKAEKN